MTNKRWGTRPWGWMVGGALALALAAPPAGAVGRLPSHTSAPAANVPTGFVEVLSSFPTLEQRIAQDVAAGNGGAWWTWMADGVQRNGSLYWWLLSDWYAAAGRPDQAYSAAVQAYVFGRLETAECTQVPPLEVGEALSAVTTPHAALLQRRMSDAVAHQAILGAVDRADAMLAANDPGVRMMCDWAQVRAAQRAAPVGGRNRSLSLADPTAAEKTAFVAAERQELRKLRKELGYDDTWRQATINDTWTASHPTTPTLGAPAAGAPVVEQPAAAAATGEGRP